MGMWLSLVAGLVLLVLGGEFLVRGTVRVAERLGVSPLVIGLTLVGFGTSTPELVTSVQAALKGAPGIAYGNVVGSNIANILLIMGGAALITPIAVASAALKRDGAVMVVVALGFAALGLLMPLGVAVGAAFVTALAFYIYMAFRQESRGAVREKADAAQSADPALAPDGTTSLPVSLLTALGGLALVVYGGYLLVEGATTLARSFGISETVIGLTVVAIGTSLPELVTSVMAAIRKQADMAFGNIIGSNIYNILGIAGVTAMVSPGNVPSEILSFDNLVMIAASLAVVGLAWTGLRISRREGALLLAGYGIYLWALWP
ncbi:cation:H+ antiporter [Limimaricola soesokkakensis]|uniref:Cation:H+ antiporter n=1 Tax=Limimaricola soesokkakensis TaxID=1343159 RepID=A0A1X6Z5M2_9RHOB|nr:calcium/sodium antiporter [Limimaricola soesokkakensis]PSK86769.1 cation:H+ antiporter [Limimaricola soesokkakensis]SLN41656.1 Inner membrane protein YrbG [Limimaricola soesokkakensis]